MKLPVPVRRNPTFQTVKEFRLLREIGSGAFSVVFEVIHVPSNSTFALKMINFHEIGLSNWLNVAHELEIHQDLDHPNVVKLYDFFVEKKILFIVLEFCPQKNLFQHINTLIKLPQLQVRRIFLEVCSAIQYLHARDIVMRDLKPENILLDSEKSAKLCDFGWAAKLGDTEYLKAKAGTYAYMSPEALMGQPQGFASDIWALGVLLYEMHYNIEPYEAENIDSQLSAIRTSDPQFDESIPAEARDLIERCLRWIPSQRPSIGEVLSHSYLVRPAGLDNSLQQNRPCFSLTCLTDAKLLGYEVKPGRKVLVNTEVTRKSQRRELQVRRFTLDPERPEPLVTFRSASPRE